MTAKYRDRQPANMESAMRRALAQRIEPRLIEPGQYECLSSDGVTIYTVLAMRDAEGGLLLRCDCQGGRYNRDENGNSGCKHAAAVALRLAGHPAEFQAIPIPLMLRAA